MPTCLSRVTFGAFLAYSPRGKTPVSARSRDLTYGIKADTAGTIEKVVDRLAREMRTSPEAAVLGAVLGPEVTLVPCPRSGLLVPGALWPAERISRALVATGLGKEVQPWLRRVKSVAKSAFAKLGERPTVQDHLDTLKLMADQEMFVPKRITVVDDVVTKGATLLAAASHLKAVFPDAEVQAFALVRTMGLVPQIVKILDPCVGEILYDGTDAERKP